MLLEMWKNIWIRMRTLKCVLVCVSSQFPLRLWICRTIFGDFNIRTMQIVSFYWCEKSFQCTMVIEFCNSLLYTVHIKHTTCIWMGTVTINPRGQISKSNFEPKWRKLVLLNVWKSNSISISFIKLIHLKGSVISLRGQWPPGGCHNRFSFEWNVVIFDCVFFFHCSSSVPVNR